MRVPYIEPVVGERRTCRCVACGSCGATFLHDAPLRDFTCPTCGLVLCQSCCDAGHGDTGQHGKIDPALVNRDLRDRLTAAESERDRLAAMIERLGEIASEGRGSLCLDLTEDGGIGLWLPEDGWPENADSAKVPEGNTAEEAIRLRLEKLDAKCPKCQGGGIVILADLPGEGRIGGGPCPCGAKVGG